ncbi:MAG: queuine/other tRNA-ribosyltransferase [Nannocystis sp.]|nr:tRNA-guanine transglycosylase DpdA [Nannocystis sp.]MBA3545551.1 queuine/other tRNA-ribosyltransferase [Nannocystis sp.]
MKYYLPDSQDLVDPSFDFTTERRGVGRVRDRDDQYAHEVFSERAFDGVLVSKAIVDGTGGAGQARYTQLQRARLARDGVHSSFRAADHRWGPLRFMGDCGAFSYIKQAAPPYTVDEVIEFYDRCGFDCGLSVDHIIPEYRPEWDDGGTGRVPAVVRDRQALTLELAADFHRSVVRGGLRLTPIGVAQGWSPRSYAVAVDALQKIGFRYVALGGVARMKTPEILRCLEAIQATRRVDTRLHLLGASRLATLARFGEYGVASFDSTSPLRQAFMADTGNYYTLDHAYSAIRVPQVEGNVRLGARIRAGEVDEADARAGERSCLRRLADYDAGTCSLAVVLAALAAYGRVHDPRVDRGAAYREVLEARPWRACLCEVCRQLGHHVALFRGAERNRRRGFHNVWVFYRRLARGLREALGHGD